MSQRRVRTKRLKHFTVEHLAVDGVLIDLPVASVHDGALIAPQHEAAAVGDRVCHPDWFTPGHMSYAMNAKL